MINITLPKIKRIILPDEYNNIKQITNIIKSNPTLQTIKLYLMETDNYNDAALHELVSSIDNLSTLKEIKIDTEEVGMDSYQMFDSILEILEMINNHPIEAFEKNKSFNGIFIPKLLKLRKVKMPLYQFNLSSTFYSKVSSLTLEINDFLLFSLTEILYECVNLKQIKIIGSLSQCEVLQLLEIVLRLPKITKIDLSENYVNNSFQFEQIDLIPLLNSCTFLEKIHLPKLKYDKWNELFSSLELPFLREFTVNQQLKGSTLPDTIKIKNTLTVIFSGDRKILYMNGKKMSEKNIFNY